LLFDPRDPRGALPKAWVEEGRAVPPLWALALIFLVTGAPGVFAWIEGMAFLLGAMPRWAFWFVALVPLGALPWWSARLPHTIANMNAGMGEILTGVLEDVNRSSSVAATTPAKARLANGERLTWRLADGHYATTLGHFRWAPPADPAGSVESARRALVASLTA